METFQLHIWRQFAKLELTIDKITHNLICRIINYLTEKLISSLAEFKIEMTAPVTVRQDTASKMWTMAFYVPAKQQGDPPTGNEVSIEERPEITVLTRSVL